MTVEAAANCWTSAEAKIATALANSAKFQEIVEAANATAAALLIFGEQVGRPGDGHIYTKDELLELKHYAQVYSADQHPYGRRNENGRFLASGTAIIYIDRLVTEYEENHDVPLATERWFKNRIGLVMEQVPSYLEANSGPFVKSIFVSDGPGTNSQDRWESEGMWQGIELLLEWGY